MAGRQAHRSENAHHYDDDDRRVHPVSFDPLIDKLLVCAEAIADLAVGSAAGDRAGSAVTRGRQDLFPVPLPAELARSAARRPPPDAGAVGNLRVPKPRG